MGITLGPILHAAQGDVDTWRLSIHVMVNHDDRALCEVRVEISGQPVGSRILVADFSAHQRSIWRFDVGLPREAVDKTVRYALFDGRTVHTESEFVVPARSRIPRTAFFSCNGFSSERVLRRVADPDALWTKMFEEHEQGRNWPRAHVDTPSAIHLLMGGGDQIYADGIEILRDLDTRADRDLDFAPTGVFDRALGQYLALYEERWSRGGFAKMAARVPCVFTWDDHDIFDGWGSHRKSVQDNPCYQEVFEAARQAFYALQLGIPPTLGTPATGLVRRASTDSRHVLQYLRLYAEKTCLDVILLDLRSDRTRNRVLSEAQWRDLRDTLLESGKESPDHLLVVSSIPVVYLRFRAISWLLERMASTTVEIEDDLRDQWEHPAHRGQRDRLLMNLLAHQQQSRSRVTFISGDVHAGAKGEIVSSLSAHTPKAGSEPARILQVVSSGIVHPSPSVIERSAVELLGSDGAHEFTPGVVTRMLEVDGAGERIWARNFLLLDMDWDAHSGSARLWMRFVVEGRSISTQIAVPGWPGRDSVRAQPFP